MTGTALIAPSTQTLTYSTQGITLSLGVLQSAGTQTITATIPASIISGDSIFAASVQTSTFKIPTAQDWHTEGHYNALADIYAGGNPAVGQSFTGNGLILNSAEFYLKKKGSPTGNAVVKIYAHSGTYGTSSVPTGSALATSDNFDVSA